VPSFSLYSVINRTDLWKFKFWDKTFLCIVVFFYKTLRLHSKYSRQIC